MRSLSRFFIVSILVECLFLVSCGQIEGTETPDIDDPQETEEDTGSPHDSPAGAAIDVDGNYRRKGGAVVLKLESGSTNLISDIVRYNFNCHDYPGGEDVTISTRIAQKIGYEGNRPVSYKTSSWNYDLGNYNERFYEDFKAYIKNIKFEPEGAIHSIIKGAEYIFDSNDRVTTLVQRAEKEKDNDSTFLHYNDQGQVIRVLTKLYGKKDSYHGYIYYYDQNNDCSRIARLDKYFLYKNEWLSTTSNKIYTFTYGNELNDANLDLNSYFINLNLNNIDGLDEVASLFNYFGNRSDHIVASMKDLQLGNSIKDIQVKRDDKGRIIQMIVKWKSSFLQDVTVFRIYYK